MPLYETMEISSSEYLKTRWYENSYGECRKAIINFAKKRNAIIRDINDFYQEFLINISGKELFVKITTDNKKSAVDIRLNAFPLTKNKQFINEFYLFLNEELKFIGKSLYA